MMKVRTYLRFWFVLCVSVLLGDGVHAQALKQRLWVTNGEVRAVLKSGRTTYIGGNFSYVGPSTGGGVILGESNAALLASPRVNGDVFAALPDGNNGWYVGGNFTSINGEPRTNIAHILPNGTPNPNWNPQANGPVFALEFGSDALYVGGSFTAIGGVSRNNAALLSLSNGAALEWNPNPNSSVRALNVAPPYVYLGGEFTLIGATQQIRNYLARTDLNLGTVDEVWNPKPNNHVLCIATAVGQNNVWFGGAFTNVDTASRLFLASVSIAGQGTATDWNPRPNGFVNVIKLVGGRLFAGGNFTGLADSTRGRLASVDPFAPRVFAWNPDVNGPVNSLAYLGSTFYVGGSFTSIGSVARNNLAAVDSAGGALAGWNPYAASEVKVVASQGNVFAGGLFRSVNGVERRNLAALDDTAGATSWNPIVSDTVRALALSGNTLYVGGSFETIGGQGIPRLGAVSTLTGQPTSWRPQVGGVNVRALQTSGGIVYAGGSFTTVGSSVRSNLAAIDSVSSAATSWDPSPNNSVAALRLSRNAIYVSGSFTLIGAQSRNRVAAVDLATGSLTSWIPSTGGVSTEISAIADNGSTVIVGGSFSLIGGQARNALAALDVSTGAVTTFNAQLNSQSTVRVLELAGNSLYVGGNLNGTSDLISVNRNTGAINPWDPRVADGVFALFPSPPDTSVYAGGSFLEVLNEPRQFLAGIIDPALVAPAFSSSSTVLHFGLVPLLQAKDDSIIVQNTGGGPLLISSANTTNSAFVVVPPIPPAVQLLPGQSRAFVIRFTPTAGGGQTGVISFGHNAQGSPGLITVTGVGSGPTFQVSKQSMQFGDVRVGLARQDTVTVANPGNLALVITGASTTYSDFEVTPTSASIPGGGSTVFTVTFRPPSPGSFGSGLSFVHNAFGSPSFVDLSGNGVASELFAIPRTLQFDSVATGSTKSLLLGIVNQGTAGLNIDSVRIGGQNAAEFSIVGSSGPFPPLSPHFDTLKIPVRFAPQSLAAKSAFLIIRSDALTNPDTILMNGSGRNSLVQITLSGDTSVGSPLLLSAEGPQGFLISIARLFYRQAGKTNFDSLTLAVNGQSYSGTFPDAVVTPRGLEYFVRLDGPQGSITNPEVDPTNSPATVRVRVSSFLSALQLEPERYRMISVPLDLNDPRPASQLVDDFGSYDPSRWRLFRWENGRNLEFESIHAPLLPGNSFWLITQDGGRFSAGVGRSVVSGRQYDIQLQPGWNQISCPFAFGVEWESVINSELLVAPYFWDGVEYHPNVRVLEPWEGYFVLNDSSAPITISMPPVEASHGLDKASQLTLRQRDYALQLSASSGELRDTYNYVGFLERATDECDKLDIPEPPMIGNYISLSILENGQKFVGNFKSPTNEGARWNLQFTSTEANRTVRIVLIEAGVLPEGFELHVLDEDEFAPVSLAGGSFEIRGGAAHNVRTFAIIIGTRAFAERSSSGIPLAPVEFSLEQNYPNPFNPVTTIRYGLNKRSNVMLEIFNVLGQKVRTLVDATQVTGLYSITWDGTTNSGAPAASGVYVYRLSTEEVRSSKKLLLLR